MNHQAFLAGVKTRLQAAFGGRFRGVVLYGSEARGEAQPDSDIDLLVLLTGPIAVWRDAHQAISAIYDRQLQIDRAIHATPVNTENFFGGRCALHRNVQREGIFA